MATKYEERFWIDQALQVSPGLAVGVLHESEAPDFIFVDQKCRIGVEVTRFAHAVRTGQAPEAELGVRRKLLRLAKRAYEEREGPPLSVVTLFSYGPSLRIGSLSSLARQIAERVHSGVVGLEPWSRFQWTHDDEPAPPGKIARLTALVLPSAKGVRWYPADAGWVSSANLNEIRAQLERKERKAANYRQRCDQLILLLVFEGTPHQGRAIHAPEAPFGEAIATHFDRIVCLDVLERRTVELRTARSTV